MLTPLLEIMAWTLIKVAALPVAEYLMRAWLRLYTMGAPEKMREDRRTEILSDLHDHIVDLRAKGLGSVEIAACIIFRLVCGSKDDVAEFAPYYPAALAQHLERGSEAISRFRTPSQLIPLLAVLGLMNSSYLASDSTQPWVELPLINGGGARNERVHRESAPPVGTPCH